MDPLGGEPCVVVVQPSHARREVVRGGDRVHVVVGARHVRAVGDRRAGHDRAQELGALGEVEGQHGARHGVQHRVPRRLDRIPRLDLVTDHVVGDVQQQLVGACVAWEHLRVRFDLLRRKVPSSGGMGATRGGCIGGYGVGCGTSAASYRNLPSRSVSRAVDTRRGLETRHLCVRGAIWRQQTVLNGRRPSEKLTSSCCAHPEANGTTPSSRSASSPVSTSGRCARFATCLTASRPRPPSSSSRRHRSSPRTTRARRRPRRHRAR